MVRAGLETPVKSRGILNVSPQLAQSLAHFDIGCLWEALEDTDRAKLLAIAAAMIEDRSRDFRTP